MSPAKPDQENQVYGMLWMMPNSEYEQWFSKLDYVPKGNLNFLFSFLIFFCCCWLVGFVVCLFCCVGSKVKCCISIPISRKYWGKFWYNFPWEINLSGEYTPWKGKTHPFQVPYYITYWGVGKLDTRNKLEEHRSIMTKDFCIPNDRYVLK